MEGRIVEGLREFMEDVVGERMGASEGKRVEGMFEGQCEKVLPEGMWLIFVDDKIGAWVAAVTSEVSIVDDKIEASVVSGGNAIVVDGKFSTWVVITGLVWDFGGKEKVGFTIVGVVGIFEGKDVKGGVEGNWDWNALGVIASSPASKITININKEYFYSSKYCWCLLVFLFEILGKNVSKQETFWRKVTLYFRENLGGSWKGLFGELNIQIAVLMLYFQKRGQSTFHSRKIVQYILGGTKSHQFCIKQLNSYPMERAKLFS